MIRFALVLLVFLTGCATYADLGGREVEIKFPEGRIPHAVRRIEAEYERAVELDGPIKREIKYIYIWNTDDLPFNPNLLGQTWWTSDAAGIHLSGKDPLRVFRHELHHARAGDPGHMSEKWEEIEAERFSD